MSLHYLVKLEMLIAHVLQLSCYRETPEFIPPQLWPPNSPDLNPDLNPVDSSVWEILQEKVYKTRITDLDELKQRLRTKLIAAAIRQWRRR